MGGGCGIVRSHLSFLGARSKPLPSVIDPFIAEVLALREGFIFAQPRGFSHMVMEVDCLEVVKIWLLHNNTRSIMTPIFQEIRERASNFASFFGLACVKGCQWYNRSLCQTHYISSGIRVLDGCLSVFPCKWPLG